MSRAGGRTPPPMIRPGTSARVRRRRLIAVGALIVVLVVGYRFWFRDSSFVEVQHVSVYGGTSADKFKVAAAVGQASKGMSTLNVDEEKLNAAVAGFPTVASIHVHADFPHRLVITVRPQPPVAVARRSGKSAPVSAKGYLLTGAPYRKHKLPSLQLLDIPKGDRLGRRDREQSELLAAMPPDLAKGVDGSRYDTELDGVVVELRNGIELRMGDATEAAAKWAAAASVLAEPDLGSPAYIDVTVPNRPAAGGYSG